MKSTTHEADLRHLRVLMPARTGPAPAAVLSRGRTALLNEIAGTPPPRRTRLLPQALAAALVLVVAGILVTAGLVGRPGSEPGDEPTALGADAASTTFLRAAAAHVAATDLPVPAQDQYLYVSSLVLYNHGAFGGPVEVGRPKPRAIWLSQGSGADDGARDVIRQDGQDWPIDYSGGSPAGIGRPTYAWLAALPTDPTALLSRLRSEVLLASGQSVDQAVFDRIGDLLRETTMPAATQAALFEATTLIPGVTFVAHVKDAAGRAGVGVSRGDRSESTRSVWIFDSTGTRYLGDRSYQLSGSRDHPVEVLFAASAVLGRAVVDRPHQVG